MGTLINVTIIDQITQGLSLPERRQPEKTGFVTKTTYHGDSSCRSRSEQLKRNKIMKSKFMNLY